MANKKSDNLYRLVHSMTKAEKRYFTIYSSHHVIGAKNSYLSLFDAIESQKKYNEEELLDLVKHYPFARRLSLTKNRLYTAILKSLDAFYAGASPEMQAKRLIERAAILYRKSLYDQSRKILHQSRKIAEKNELPLILEEISRWEKRLIEKNGYSGITTTQLRHMKERDERNVGIIHQHNELWNIKSNLLLALYQNGKVRSENDVVGFRHLIEDAAAKTAAQFNDTENTYLTNHLWSVYHFSIGEYEACYPYLKKLISLSAMKPEFFKQDPSMLPAIISNAVFVGISLGRKKEAYSWFERLKKITTQNHESATADMQIRMFSLRTSTELTLYIKSGDYNRGLAALPRIEEGLEKFDSKLSDIRKTHLLFNMTIILFNCGRYHEALGTLNRILNMPNADKRTDIFCMSQVLNLIIHFELGNIDLLGYALRSARRYLVSRKKVYHFEKIILTFINEMIKKRRTKTDAEMFNELAASLRPLQDNKFESAVFEYFDFLGWATSKSAANIAGNKAA